MFSWDVPAGILNFGQFPKWPKGSSAVAYTPANSEILGKAWGASKSFWRIEFLKRFTLVQKVGIPHLRWVLKTFIENGYWGKTVPGLKFFCAKISISFDSIFELFWSVPLLIFFLLICKMWVMMVIKVPSEVIDVHIWGIMDPKLTFSKY